MIICTIAVLYSKSKTALICVADSGKDNNEAFSNAIGSKILCDRLYQARNWSDEEQELLFAVLLEGKEHDNATLKQFMAMLYKKDLLFQWSFCDAIFY